MIKFDGETTQSQSNIDTSNPVKIELTFLGDSVGNYLWDGHHVTIQRTNDDKFFNQLVDDIYNASDFFDFRNDIICHNNATDDIEAFTVKVGGEALKNGLGMEIKEQ